MIKTASAYLVGCAMTRTKIRCGECRRLSLGWEDGRYDRSARFVGKYNNNNTLLVSNECYGFVMLELIPFVHSNSIILQT